MGNRTLKQIFSVLILVIITTYIRSIQYLHHKKVLHYDSNPISRDNWTLDEMIRYKRSLFELINPPNAIYPYSGTYNHENRKLCSSVRNLTLLVLVLSSPKNFKYRKTLRDTWANETLYKSLMNVRFVYLLGSVYDQILQDNIDREFSRYGDIIQGGFVDSYDNLTHKSAMGFRWAYERCRNAKYVIKTDDDVVIDLFKVFKNSISNYSKDKFQVYCHRKTNIIVRNEGEKWYIDKEQLKGFTRYPPYCIGLFVMISNDVVPYIYDLLTWSPFFLLEDVLIYGFLLRNIQGLKYKQVAGYEISWDPAFKNKAINCLESRKRECPISIHLLATPAQIALIWKTIVKVYAEINANNTLQLSQSFKTRG